MAYAYIVNNEIIEYPLYPQDIINKFSNVSFSNPFVPPDNYVWVEEQTMPGTQYDEKVIKDGIKFIDGVPTLTWRIEKKTQDEIDLAIYQMAGSIRRSRNDRLHRSDWTQILDAPVDQKAWQEYRQKLRDITKQETFPFSVTWPEQP